jgi:hypothetical protein
LAEFGPTLMDINVFSGLLFVRQCIFHKFFRSISQWTLVY